ncbi:MAG: Sodium, potassium, lithium and rubidium/H(+) antiporter [Candidatus Erwinia impunctatus]|nr:Sodium, potassium, lithium and rubidium/H(+) antiporter [Culicoides impunctatus]
MISLCDGTKHRLLFKDYMEIFFTILILTLVVSLSGVAARIIPFQIPLPLVQILMGALLAWPTFGLHVDFDPELFLVLFIPPLLFADGWKTPTSEFLRHGREIIGLALVLVLITVVGIGYLIYWMVPGIPLLSAFALAAVLSPTDAVALSGIVGEGRIPKRIMAILQGEALMNDASGLVSLKFAVAVAMGTMVFTVSGATFEFLKVAIGGLLAGIAICWLYGKSLRLFSHWAGDDPATQTVLLLLLPFASYLIAEHIGVSGILAAVAAGMTITRSGIIRQAPLAMRLRANSVWQMLEFVFNGMVFLMLGLQLPGILEASVDQAHADPNLELWMLFLSVALIYAALLIVRFGWLWMMQQISKRWQKKHPMVFSSYTTRDLFIASFAGVRGAITLAGVLSIPLFLHNGDAYPARYELVFLATGVILFSLLVGVITLPLLLRGIPGMDKAEHRQEVQMARATMAEIAIDSLHKMEARLVADSEENIDPELLKEVSSRVIGNLRRRVDGKDDLEHSLYVENLERRFRLTALRSERGELYHLRATQKISNETMQKLLHELDLLEILLTEKEE